MRQLYPASGFQGQVIEKLTNITFTNFNVELRLLLRTVLGAPPAVDWACHDTRLCTVRITMCVIQGTISSAQLVCDMLSAVLEVRLRRRASPCTSRARRALERYGTVPWWCSQSRISTNLVRRNVCAELPRLSVRARKPFTNTSWRR